MIEINMPLPRHVTNDTDRHGNPRLYYREGHGPRIRITVMPGHPDFDAAVAAARQGQKWFEGKGIQRVPAAAANGTLRALVRDYYKSGDYRDLDASTKSKRSAILDGCMAELVHPARADVMGDCPLTRFSTAHVETLRSRKDSTPEAANGRVKAIRRVFNWAMKEKPPLATSNPAVSVKINPSVTGGWHTWTCEEVEQFWARHPIGTKARLTMDIMLFTGLRISDAARLGRPHVSNENVLIVQAKNHGRKRKELQFPILPVLRQSINACPSKGLTFIETKWGRPHSVKGLGNEVRDWCDEAGLPLCTAHGLRKAGATFAAENGATAHQLMAIFGWTRIEQAEVYTRAVNAKRMAQNSMHLLMPNPSPRNTMDIGEGKTEEKERKING